MFEEGLMTRVNIIRAKKGRGRINGNHGPPRRPAL